MKRNFYVIAGKTIQFYGHEGEKKGEEKKTIRHHVLQIANFSFICMYIDLMASQNYQARQSSSNKHLFGMNAVDIYNIRK